MTDRMLETDLAWNGLMAKTGRDNQELSVKIVDRQIAYQTDDDDDDDELSRECCAFQ